jgi:hypothetical protein
MGCCQWEKGAPYSGEMRVAEVFGGINYRAEPPLLNRISPNAIVNIDGIPVPVATYLDMLANGRAGYYADGAGRRRLSGKRRRLSGKRKIRRTRRR